MTSLTDALAALAARVGGSGTSTDVDGTTREAQRAAGERAAAAALAAAGSRELVLRGRGEDGCPLFPRGYAGSIAHTDQVAVAVAAERSQAIAALGIDVEVASALEARDAELVLNPAERALVAAHPSPDWFATLLWTAKEAAFKAWSAAAGALGQVDPVDIAVATDEATATLEVRATGALGYVVEPFGPAVGGYADVDGTMLTLVRVAAPAAAG